MTNKVREAVDRIGGPSRTANLVGVSGVTVHNWMLAQRIPNIEKAIKVAKHSGFTVEELRPIRSAWWA